MKGKAAVAMVMQVAKLLDWQEESVILGAAFYNGGKWVEYIDKDEAEDLVKDYENGIVGEKVTDFCLDVLSGREPPNRVMNKIRFFAQWALAQNIKKKKV